MALSYGCSEGVPIVPATLEGDGEGSSGTVVRSGRGERGDGGQGRSEVASVPSTPDTTSES